MKQQWRIGICEIQVDEHDESTFGGIKILAVIAQVSLVAIVQLNIFSTDQHLSECRPKLQCDFLIARKGFHLGVSHIARLSSTDLCRSHTPLVSAIRNEFCIFLEALAPQGHVFP